MPDELGLTRYNLNAGLSTQALYLGKKLETYEALYVSNGLTQYYDERPTCIQNQLVFE